MPMDTVFRSNKTSVDLGEMTKIKVLELGLLSAVLLLAGCVFPVQGHHPHGMPPGQAKKSVHVHGHSCGHVHVNGNWILKGKQ